MRAWLRSALLSFGSPFRLRLGLSQLLLLHQASQGTFRLWYCAENWKPTRIQKTADVYLAFRCEPWWNPSLGQSEAYFLKLAYRLTFWHVLGDFGILRLSAVLPLPPSFAITHVLEFPRELAYSGCILVPRPPCLNYRYSASQCPTYAHLWTSWYRFPSSQKCFIRPFLPTPLETWYLVRQSFSPLFQVSLWRSQFYPVQDPKAYGGEGSKLT